MNLEGSCDPRFQAVRDEFERNFGERGEIGASICVIVAGRTVVDLWGGIADRRTGRPWDRDTIGLVWSSTKGATALCAHVLAARGQLDLGAPVARYWPEFAQAGKERVTVMQLLTHRCGLPVNRRRLRPGGLYDWDYMVGELAAEEPMWAPGDRQAYGASTFGHLVGEVVARVSGQPFAAFLRREITGPLGLDFHLGLAEADEARVAPTVRPDPTPVGSVKTRFLAATADETSIAGIMIRNTGRQGADHDSREAHQAVLPSSGAITNSRGLAGLYAPLAAGGGGLVDAATLATMGAEQSTSTEDGTLRIGLRVGPGFWKSSDNRSAPPDAQDSIILSESAFGHPGMGGSVGFADPPAQLAFGYTMNKQGRGVALNERGQSLVDAVYRCLGCRSNASGSWE